MYQYLMVERIHGAGLITLNRPQARNALSIALMRELQAALVDFDTDPGIGAIVLTGGPVLFSTGADIREMLGKSYIDLYEQDFPDTAGWLWQQIARCRKPLVAAVAGMALGGGCELALACDLVIAADDARFGQPEVKLGTMPGAGGTQRLARSVGKAKAMDLCLTGRTVSSAEAERMGMISRVVAPDSLLAEALTAAQAIAALSLPAVMAIKESINLAFESGLSAGLQFERRAFQATFATNGPAEGIDAFLAKRKPCFTAHESAAPTSAEHGATTAMPVLSDPDPDGARPLREAIVAR
jgi:enoyl-CoA hydratase